MRARSCTFAVATLMLTVPTGPASRADGTGSTRWFLAYPGTNKGGMGIRYDVDDFVRVLGAVDSTGRVTSWLCTGVIFLQLYAASGRTFTTWIGGTAANGADWHEYLDSIVGAGGALTRLDSAVGVVAAQVGALAGPLPVAIMIPYPEPKSDSIRFEGKSYDLRSAAGRVDAVDSYVKNAVSRFQAGRFTHLRLDGFYWLKETISGADEEAVRGVSSRVHAQRLRFLWIPYFGAAGQTRWKELGFDEAWLQPNYFFTLSLPPDRLDSAAVHAQGAGLGIALEFNARVFADFHYAVRLDPYLDMLKRFPGFQGRSMAVYDGQGALIRLSRSSDPRDRGLYLRLVSALTSRGSK